MEEPLQPYSDSFVDNSFILYKWEDVYELYPLQPLLLTLTLNINSFKVKCELC